MPCGETGDMLSSEAMPALIALRGGSDAITRHPKPNPKAKGKAVAKKIKLATGKARDAQVETMKAVIERGRKLMQSISKTGSLDSLKEFEVDLKEMRWSGQRDSSS